MKGEVNQRFLLELGTACQMEHPQTGGVFQESLKRCSTTLFHYLSHSSWVAPANRTPARRSREIGEDESDPPEKRGVMWPR